MRCSKARELISLYVAPDGSWLSPQDRHALEAHLAVCEPCRQDCRESLELVGILQACWQINPDTVALLEKSRESARLGGAAKVARLPKLSRRAASWSTAACLLLGVLGTWVLLHGWASSPGPDGPTTLAGEVRPPTIELADGSRIVCGTVLQTSHRETQRLILNGRHDLVMNAGTRLSIDPLMDAGQAGCQVNLALGEIYVHVEHDGNPFEVRSPHGTAVVTGTRFRVEATEACTTLVVVEGSVRFESEAGAVHVTAGQQSVIAKASVPPGAPVTCDAIALTAWTQADRGTRQVAPIIISHEVFLDHLPLLPSSSIRTDLQDSSYAQWAEQHRDWFKRQFPWIFALQEALSEEGMDISYPDLLMQSGDLWLFAYPGTASGRQIEPDPNGLLRTVSRYGRDEHWLQQRSLSSLRPVHPKGPAMGAAAFEQWARRWDDKMRRDPTSVNEPILFTSWEACTYLVRTRILAALAVEEDRVKRAPDMQEELVGLLHAELQALAECQEHLHELSAQAPRVDPCACSDRVDRLIDTIVRIGTLERQVRQIWSELP